MSALEAAKKAAPFIGHIFLAFVVFVGAELLGFGTPSITDGLRAYLVGMLPFFGVMLALALCFRAMLALAREWIAKRRGKA